MENGMEEKERPHSCISNEDLISKDGCQGIVGSERSLLNSSVVLSAGSSSSNSSCKDETSGNSSNNDTKSVHCSQNGRKQRPHNKFLGVRQRPSGRWVAEIKDASQKLRVWLGTFDSAEDAARAYDDAARFLRGKNTRTNFAENNNSRNMQGRSSSSSKVARFLLLRHALAKTTQKNNNCTGKNHDGGATVFPQVAYHCNNISTSNKNIISISNNGGFPMGLSASASACYNQVITNSMTNAGLQLSHSLLSNTQGHPKAAATTTNTTQTALLSNDTFDRFCTSGWTLKLQEVNHEQKSNSSNQSQRKTGSTVRVAPSFNASLYSETEKWYQNPAVLLSRDHTSLL